jgi:hypothetical protein
MREADAEDFLVRLRHNARLGTAPFLQPRDRCSRLTRAQWPHESGHYMREIRHLRKGELVLSCAMF